MNRWAGVAVVATAAILAGCHPIANPYRSSSNPAGQNPAGTPADGTGGARDVPDGAGGAPGINAWPAES